MKNVQKLSITIKALAEEYIPPKLHQRFLNGVWGLALKDFRSLAGNGRLPTDNPRTGEKQMERTSGDTRFTGLIAHIIWKHFLPKSGLLHLSLDHSQFGRFYIAVLALSIGKGRDLPLWREVGYRDKPTSGSAERSRCRRPSARLHLSWLIFSPYSLIFT